MKYEADRTNEPTVAAMTEAAIKALSRTPRAVTSRSRAAGSTTPTTPATRIAP
jgi:hypothetical protein